MKTLRDALQHINRLQRQGKFYPELDQIGLVICNEFTDRNEVDRDLSKLEIALIEKVIEMIMFGK